MTTPLSSYGVGDKVLFGRANGEQTLGEVVKVNRVKLKVKQLTARGMYRNYPIGSVWIVPVSLCEPYEGEVPAAPVAPPKPARTEVEVKREVLGIYCALSPENLTCDGELGHAEVVRRAAALKRRLQACFVELGREVSEEEAYRELVAKLWISVTLVT